MYIYIYIYYENWAPPQKYIFHSWGPLLRDPPFGGMEGGGKRDASFMTKTGGGSLPAFLLALRSSSQKRKNI